MAKLKISIPLIILLIILVVLIFPDIKTYTIIFVAGLTLGYIIP